MFYLFYRLLNLFSTVPIPNDAGNFGLIDRRVVDVLARLDENDRYYPGLRRWVGFRQTGIRVERGRRHDRQPRVSYLGLFRLAKTALFSFSSAPIGLVYLVALVSVLVFAVSTSFALYHKLVTGLDVGSWTITVTVASFFGALNALGIGILGEYAVRIYEQVRGRPKFLIASERNFAVSHSRAHDELPADTTGRDRTPLAA